MKSFQIYWKTKTPKERLVLLALGISCGIILLWSLFILPVTQRLEALGTEVKAKKNLLLSLDLTSDSGQLSSLNKPLSLDEILLLMKSFDMNAQLQEEKEKEYLLTFSALNFDKLILFIEQCYIQYGLKLESLKTEHLVQQGFVSGEAKFGL